MERISYNKTKIVATVGPASSSKEMLRALLKEGVDVFRLNFSYGIHEDHLKVIHNVWELNEEMGISVVLLQDFQGSKIRINDVQPDVELKARSAFGCSSCWTPRVSPALPIGTTASSR